MICRVHDCCAEINVAHHIECEWQKSNAEMIWRKNLRASFGVSRPFFTK